MLQPADSDTDGSCPGAPRVRSLGMVMIRGRHFPMHPVEGVKLERSCCEKLLV